MDNERLEGRRSNERRSEPRSLADQYTRVEFSAGDLEPVYLFKIWDISPSGMSILVRGDSAVLKHLKVGDVCTMKYYSSRTSESPKALKTEIRHITEDYEGRFKGHYLVGLSIRENQETSA
jgi:hypothetical protein